MLSMLCCDHARKIITHVSNNRIHIEITVLLNALHRGLIQTILKKRDILAGVQERDILTGVQLRDILAGVQQRDILAGVQVCVLTWKLILDRPVNMDFNLE